MTSRTGIDTNPTPPVISDIAEDLINIADRDNIFGLNGPYTDPRSGYMETKTGKTWALATDDPVDGIYTGFGNDLVFERIWVVPNEVNARYITTDTSHTVNIWNAYQHINKYFTNVSAYNPAGTSIVNPTLPFNLQPTADLNITINVFRIGPSVQYSIYSLTIGGVVFQIPVRGLRILALAELPDFGAEPELSYGYDVSVFTTDRNKEQRRSIRDIPLRELKGEFLVRGTPGQQFINRLQYAHDKILGVPIIDEALIPTNIATGAQSITLSNTTTDKWNFINLCSFIGIWDPLGNQVEIHEVDSYTANTITTVNNIQLTYQLENTTIFPVFFGVISSLRITEHTDGIESAQIEFKETKISGV